MLACLLLFSKAARAWTERQPRITRTGGLKSSLTRSMLVQVFIVSLPHRTTWAQQRSSWAWDELVCWNWLSPKKYWWNDYRLRLEMQACVKLRNAFGPVMSKVRMQFQAKRVICVDRVFVCECRQGTERETEKMRGTEWERERECVECVWPRPCAFLKVQPVWAAPAKLFFKLVVELHLAAVPVAHHRPIDAQATRAATDVYT